MQGPYFLNTFAQYKQLSSTLQSTNSFLQIHPDILTNLYSSRFRMSKPSENAAWIATLQSTVSELVTELFNLLGSGEAGKSCIPLTSDFPTFERPTIHYVFCIYIHLSLRFHVRRVSTQSTVLSARALIKRPSSLSFKTLMVVHLLISLVTSIRKPSETLRGKLDNLPHDLIPLPSCIQCRYMVPTILDKHLGQ